VDARTVSGSGDAGEPVVDSQDEMRLESAFACVSEGLAAAIERARLGPCEPSAFLAGGGETRRRAVECRLIDAILAGAAS
jgi:hypothetical protein